MNAQGLFIELVHRLNRYPEAIVLAAALEQHADTEEFKTTATQLSLDLLGGVIEKKQVQRSLDRLQEMGFLEVRTHANYRTHIKVDRAAVEALLRKPVSAYLSGLRDVSFPFLDQVNASGKASSTSSVVPIRGD